MLIKGNLCSSEARTKMKKEERIHRKIVSIISYIIAVEEHSIVGRR